MRIFYFCRNSLELYPPCISQILFLKELGNDVTVCFGSCSKNVKNILKDLEIKYHDFGISREPFGGKIEKITSIQKYKLVANKFIKKNYRKNDILWFGTADSAFFVSSALEGKNYVLSILELYDNNNYYRKKIGEIINDAICVISCEKTRALIMKSWWKLDKVPYVIPNKPYHHPLKPISKGTTPETSKMIYQMSDKFVILYQGIISNDRDLKVLAEALNLINKDIYLALMGKEINSSAETIKQIYDKTIILGYVPAPLHLEVTGFSKIGVAYYDDSSLNNLFCAPNKIFEYGGFNLPILCNDVPGLVDTVGKYRAGVCCDFSRPESIKSALEEILTSYNEFSHNSRELFNSVSNIDVIRNIIKEIKKN